MTAQPWSHLPDGVGLEAMDFESIAGWHADNHSAAFATFQKSASAPHPAATVRQALVAPSRLVALLAAAVQRQMQDRNECRAFFEENFNPYKIVPATGEGFLTAYFEPEYAGSLVKTEHFSAPLRARPRDLVTLSGPPPSHLPQHLAAARETPEGLEAFPDRTAIEEGALANEQLERIWLDPVDKFFMQVQGSGRIRLANGQVERFAYAGRNGHAYTSIGKAVVAEGHMRLDDMTLEGFTGWLKARPVEAKRIMRLNRSYVFFERVTDLPAESGPIGGAGTPLTPHRSIAVDRSIWCYGLPFWLSGTLPETLETAEPLNRLMIAQDTGSAILGAARADYFMGMGAEAGRRAGLVRHKTDFIVLLPKP
jgi:membrane-bound lytic murein transglycosylase A